MSTDKKPPLTRGIWKHYKGPLYLVLETSTHCETREEIVHYVCLYGDDFHTHSQERTRFEQLIEVVELGHKDGPPLSLMSKESFDTQYGKVPMTIDPLMNGRKLTEDEFRNFVYKNVEAERLEVRRTFMTPRFEHVYVRPNDSSFTKTTKYTEDAP